MALQIVRLFPRFEMRLSFVRTDSNDLTTGGPLLPPFTPRPPRQALRILSVSRSIGSYKGILRTIGPLEVATQLTHSYLSSASYPRLQVRRNEQYTLEGKEKLPAPPFLPYISKQILRSIFVPVNPSILSITILGRRYPACIALHPFLASLRSIWLVNSS
jgi:hypothetical protein